MKQYFLKVTSGDRYYVKLPDAFYGDEVEIHLFVPKEFVGKYIRIEPVNDPVQNKVVYVPENKRASEMNLATCHVIPFQHSEKDPIHLTRKTEKVEEPRPTIPGHPNCHYGECLECHVVSCAIYQGYEPIPDGPEEER